MTTLEFSERKSILQVEEGTELAPKFGPEGLMPCVTTDAQSGEVLMLGWMDRTAFERSITTGEAHYYSRSRQAIWHKGATSGLVQKIVQARIDDDQDAIWISVSVGASGASCHVGYRSCFYRSIPTGTKAGGALKFLEDKKLFDPEVVYAGMPNPTKL